MKGLDTDVYLDPDFTQATGGGTGQTSPNQSQISLPSDISPVGQNVITAPSEAAARNAISAAGSGANADINTFSALTGSTGWSAWTGTANKASHATYSATAGVLYDQTLTQALMDKVKELSEANKALLDTLLASGVIRA